MRRSCGWSSRAASRTNNDAMLLAALFNEFCDQAGPAGLMAGADASAIIAVKVFIEKNQVAPMGIALKNLGSSRDRAAAVRITQEDVNEAAGNFCGNLPKVAFLGGMCGALHFEILTVVVVELLKRFHQEIIHREPDGTAPVRIASENAGGRFRRLIGNAACIAVHVNFVGMVLVESR